MWCVVFLELPAMFTRPMLFLGVLVASVVVPYVVLNEELAETARGHWQRLARISGPGDDEQAANTGPVDITKLAPSAASPGAAIEEAFRFDISPQWVSRRWGQVSMVHGGLDHL